MRPYNKMNILPSVSEQTIGHKPLYSKQQISNAALNLPPNHSWSNERKVQH